MLNQWMRESNLIVPMDDHEGVRILGSGFCISAEVHQPYDNPRSQGGTIVFPLEQLSLRRTSKDL